MLTLFGWTYDQYLFAIGTLRIRPEEVKTLLDVKEIWTKSIIRDIDPITEIQGSLFDPFFRDLTDKLWQAGGYVCSRCQGII